MQLHSTTQAITASVIVGASTVLGYYFYKRMCKNRIPTQWEPIGTVAEMYMYPLKSGKRLEITSAKCTEFGLQSEDPSLPHFRDRCLVIYQEGTNEIKSARTYPKMLWIETSTVGNNHYSLNAPEMDTLMLEVPHSSAKQDCIQMWQQEKILTIDCGNEAAEWISMYVLGKPSGLRLGYHNGQHRRDIEKYHGAYKKWFPNLGNFAGGMYSDLATLLLMTKPSMTDLEQRIPDLNVTIHNFRPNLVIDSDKLKPYDEDEWEWVKIGDVVLQNVMLCNRCALTTINPETAQFTKNYEPVTTMRTYRSTVRTGTGPASPNMGVYLGMKQEGSIKVNDVVYVGKC
ncbi:hypothetical protein FQR65_LT10691 [Abscondita terminalis]|nr:hypothetical protein FQR65_LT10691 [Abscondita terminalis]